MGVHVDPRAATSTVVAGPADLVGDELVVLDQVVVDGQMIGVPRLLPGAAEWATVTTAEASADAHREAALGKLDDRAVLPCVDIAAGVEFRLNAGIAVASAGVGLEAYANFHLQRLSPATAADAANRPLNDRYADDLPAAFGISSPAQEPWWSDFRRIQGLAALQRHAVEWPTTRRGLTAEKTLNQRFYDREYAGAAETMHAVFEYFTPGWISSDRQAALRALTSRYPGGNAQRVFELD